MAGQIPVPGPATPFQPRPSLSVAVTRFAMGAFAVLVVIVVYTALFH